MAAEPKLVIATPLFGMPTTATVHWAYADAMLSFIKDTHVDRIPGVLMCDCDLVRARSRAVRLFLETDATHLLFWDSDVVPTDMNVVGTMMGIMIASGKEILAISYPRKIVRWDSLAASIHDEQEMAEHGRHTGNDLEKRAYNFTTRPGIEQPDGTILVPEVGMGFTMLSRSCLEKMTARYADELTFIDDYDGKKSPTVALFQLTIRGDNRMLAPEDYSFCYRWRDMGGQIFIMPTMARHIGSHVFGETF